MVECIIYCIVTIVYIVLYIYWRLVETQYSSRFYALWKMTLTPNSKVVNIILYNYGYGALVITRHGLISHHAQSWPMAGRLIGHSWRWQRSISHTVTLRSDPLTLTQLLCDRHRILLSYSQVCTAVQRFLFTRIDLCLIQHSAIRPRGSCTVNGQVFIDHHEIILRVFNHYGSHPSQRSIFILSREAIRIEI